MDDRAILFVVFQVSGLLLAALALPLIEEKIGPNAWYGFRLPGAFRDEKTWYAVNHFGGVRLAWSGLLIALAALVLYLVRSISIDQFALGMTAVAVLSLALTLAQTVRFMRSLG